MVEIMNNQPPIQINSSQEENDDNVEIEAKLKAILYEGDNSNSGIEGITDGYTTDNSQKESIQLLKILEEGEIPESDEDIGSNFLSSDSINTDLKREINSTLHKDCQKEDQQHKDSSQQEKTNYLPVDLGFVDEYELIGCRGASPTASPIFPPLNYNSPGSNCSSDYEVLHKKRKKRKNKRNHKPVKRLFELCKFYVNGTCHNSSNGRNCTYMHSDFPCKYYYLGIDHNSDNCKFSHGAALSESKALALARHISLAPTSLLGNFPRMSLDDALERIRKNSDGVLSKGKRLSMEDKSEDSNHSLDNRMDAVLNNNNSGFYVHDVDMRVPFQACRIEYNILKPVQPPTPVNEPLEAASSLYDDYREMPMVIVENDSDSTYQQMLSDIEDRICKSSNDINPPFLEIYAGLTEDNLIPYTLKHIHISSPDYSETRCDLLKSIGYLSVLFRDPRLEQIFRSKYPKILVNITETPEQIYRAPL